MTTVIINGTTGITYPDGSIQATSFANNCQGRLTLTTATPVMISTTSAQTIIYYTPYIGNTIPIYNGSKMVQTTFTELSNVTSASSSGSAGPAAVTTNSNYDLFVWNNSGTVTLTRGPSWTSDTARGTGASTTQLTRILGVLTNTVAITNGPGAGLGTYVGTVRSNGTSTIDWILGAVGNPATAAMLGIWNCFNRILVRGFLGDSTSQYAYTTATVRSANASNTTRVSYIQGLQEDAFWAEYAIGYSSSNGTSANAGIGYDSTSAFSGRIGAGIAINSVAGNTITGSHSAQGLGFHFMQACEYSIASGTTSWYAGLGNGYGAVGQFGLTYSGMF